MTNHDSTHHAAAESEPLYRDRAGNPIDVVRWGELWSDFEYRRVAESRVEGTDIVVRTVWEGAISPVSPMFATGVLFDGGHRFSAPRYGEEARTEKEALAQHERAVDEVRSSRPA
ncbi:hypothetical protein [Saccharothrix sp. ST-888]|uniref:hypothetical protein n=1 Tax=Saccharothrix sp. ST-888 TaxID=1427391 RepID=UPI0005EC4A68|nr:hypothetical protein [Saccharothrix sp. ST-888]KJK56243.1 hypothetical protein UK12_23970 [Saccharothrix sp. ST-888]